MISERREFLETVAKEEEQLVSLQARKELLTTSLKNKYAIRDGVEKDLQVARDNAVPTLRNKTRQFLFEAAGKKGEQKALSGIRHNYAAHLQERLRAVVPVLEEEVRSLITLRADTAKALDTRREEVEQTRRELVDYIGALREDPKEALAAYQKASRTHRLLANASESGHTYLAYLEGLQKQFLGAAATARRPMGAHPYFDILLQRAYTRQGELWSASAEILQFEFLTDLRTLDAMTPHKYRTAGQIAFSPLFFDNTLTRLLTLRKGDELHTLLEQAIQEVRQLFARITGAREEAAAELKNRAEAAGLVMEDLKGDGYGQAL